MPEFATALDVADQVTWWPSPLRVSVPDGKTEQDVYAGHMRADPEGWREKIRGATSDLIARLAWEDIQTVRPYLAQVEEKLSVTYSELAESLDRANLTISELGRAESEVLEAQNANRILDGMLAAANEKIELQAREIKAMRSTVAWRLSVLLKRVPSLLRRQ
ncbi:hypothetical protein [Rhizobium giardinii]|uniref:Putative transcriptional regulator n=1 Tax=Rhizobium giardinii TaxID=56731 RepID=A0A7W8X7J0_9HYPH|nr:hypothetical protein [Rhizobium giardinii]MBB5535159.1 putative transcriptional regulator [Rhizobium giardinii]